MRRQHVPLDVAARREGVAPDVAEQFASGGRGAPACRRAIRSKPDGSATARRADRMLRPIPVIEAGVGPVVVDVRGSDAASTVSAYWHAVNRYRETGDDTLLRRFAGTLVGGVELETDTDVIDALTSAGAINFESFYEPGL